IGALSQPAVRDRLVVIGAVGLFLVGAVRALAFGVKQPRGAGRAKSVVGVLAVWVGTVNLGSSIHLLVATFAVTFPSPAVFAIPAFIEVIFRAVTAIY